MSNKKGGKNVQTKASESGVDRHTKASEPVVEKKRKSISGDAERSPLRVAVKSPIPKKDLKFRNHFPEGILKCRPGTEFSDDDDDESIAIKEVEIALVKEKNAAYFEQLDPEAAEGEDCPFFSNLIWPNCSKLNFGLAQDMHPNFFDEAGRRICEYYRLVTGTIPVFAKFVLLRKNVKQKGRQGRSDEGF